MRKHKRIPGNDRYRIYVDGKIYDKLNRRFLKPHLNNSGYLRVVLDDRRKYLVHRLVAITFISNPHSYEVVMHMDNNKTNNHISNLKWRTHSENTKQAYIEGRLKNTFKKGIGNGLIGDNNPRSKLSIKQRKKILKLYNTGNYTFSELGRMYNVTRITIRDHCVNYNFKKLKP